MALGFRMLGGDERVVCEVSDGELQEGQVWEAIMAASHLHVDNLVVVVDNNNMQADGRTADIMAVEPLEERFRAFGWSVDRMDGHDIPSLLAGFERALSVKNLPSVLICDTVPGKGSPTLEAFRHVHYIRATREIWDSALSEIK